MLWKLLHCGCVQAELYLGHWCMGTMTGLVAVAQLTDWEPFTRNESFSTRAVPAGTRALLHLQLNHVVTFSFGKPSVCQSPVANPTSNPSL